MTLESYSENISFCHAVASYIEATASTVKTWAEDTGGDNICVYLEFREFVFYFGTANETWGGSGGVGENDCTLYIETGIPTSEADPVKVARGILATILSDEFSRILNEWLPAGQMEEVRKRNLLEPSSQICHSHDFCDANMAMLEAFQNYGVKAACDLEDGTPEHEASCELWGMAWNLSVSRQFKSEVD